MNNWLTRPGYIALLAFLAGGAIAAAIVLIVTRGDGDDDDGSVTGGTPTAQSTAVATLPEGTPPTSTPGATATAAAATDPDGALVAYVERELDGEYGGACSAGPAVGTYCSSDLYRGEDLVTVLLGLAQSEFTHEVVITPNEDGTWSVDGFLLPDPDAALSIGAEAIVHRSETCLNFRTEPTTSAGAPTCQLDGTRGTVDDGPVVADGITWWHLEGLGWASAEFLGVAPP